MFHDMFRLCLTRHTCDLHRQSTQHAKAALAACSHAVSAVITNYREDCQLDKSAVYSSFAEAMLDVTAHESNNTPGDWKRTHAGVGHVLSNQQHLTRHAHSILILLLNDILPYYPDTDCCRMADLLWRCASAAWASDWLHCFWASASSLCIQICMCPLSASTLTCAASLSVRSGKHQKAKVLPE